MQFPWSVLRDRCASAVGPGMRALAVWLAVAGAHAHATAPQDPPVTPLSGFAVEDVYGGILRVAAANDGPGDVPSRVAPVFGVRTNEPFDSPTFVGANGLRAVLRGDVPFGIVSAGWLLEHARVVRTADGLPARLSVFDVDYGSKYPYAMAAPWSSALSQGLGLELCAQLFARTGDARFRDAADQLYRGYQVPIDAGGFLRTVDGAPLFEEYPTPGHPTLVFNGYAVAVLALRGYSILCERPDAERLLQRSLDGFADLAEPLEVDLDGVLQTRYSLARRRYESLFRFVRCQGDLLVDSVELLADGATFAALDVGSPVDLDVMASGYVWENPVYQGWGGRETEDGVDWRNAHGHPEARYAHAPMTLAVPASTSVELRLVVRWRGDGQAEVAVHSDGWHPLGTLAAARLGAGDHEWSVSEFAVPVAWTGARDPAELLERVERKYLDDNAALMELLASVHGRSDSPFHRLARRWSADWIEFYRQGGDVPPPNVDARGSFWPLREPAAPGGPTEEVGSGDAAPEDAVSDGAAVLGHEAGRVLIWRTAGAALRASVVGEERSLASVALEAEGSLGSLLEAVPMLGAQRPGGDDSRWVFGLGDPEQDGSVRRVLLSRGKSVMPLPIEGRPLAAAFDAASSLGFVVVDDLGFATEVTEPKESSEPAGPATRLVLWLTDDRGRATRVRTIAALAEPATSGFVRWMGPDRVLVGVFTPVAIELFWLDPVRKDTAPAGRALAPHLTLAGGWRTADGSWFARRIDRGLQLRRLDMPRLESRLLDFDEAFRAFATSWYGSGERR